MTTILLVDDDPFVLKSLVRCLRRSRPAWSCSFAANGAAALDELAKTDFDVVVSDMRMPGMDGAELLTRVRDAYPRALRVVLSGQAEGAQMDRAASVAHAFLGKPTPVSALVTCIEGALALPAVG